MANRWLTCLSCKERGAKSPEFRYSANFEQGPVCPDCGNSDTDLMELCVTTITCTFGTMVDIKNQTQAEIDMDRRAQKYYERNADKIKSGELPLKFPKKRNRTFDPSFQKELH